MYKIIMHIYLKYFIHAHTHTEREREELVFLMKPLRLRKALCIILVIYEQRKFVSSPFKPIFMVSVSSLVLSEFLIY